MSRYSETLADLKRQRLQIDAAIAALLALEPTSNGNGHKKPTARPQQHYGKVRPEQWERARKLWDRGVSAVQIGKHIGITDVSVHYHAKAHGWPKRKRGVRAVEEMTLPGKVRCQECEQLTDTDPCACGAKVAFKS